MRPIGKLCGNYVNTDCSAESTKLTTKCTSAPMQFKNFDHLRHTTAATDVKVSLGPLSDASAIVE